MTVIGDREAAVARNLRRSWPTTATPLEALEDVEPGCDVRHRMHGKVLVADRARALVGSANFSAGGLGHNVEFGVIVEGEVAERMCRTVETLRDQGWLRAV